MSTFRFQALRKATDRKPVHVEELDRKSAIFGSNVFNDKAMRQFLTPEAYKAVKAAAEGVKIDRKIADYIAMGMKAWALSKGVTHYTHWFQPLTGGTAEKHDAFFETSFDGSDPVEKFGGDQLVQQEPDASSFPNGGIRNTFEARGYTAWDPSSPAFIWGRTLCIPTIFVSYTGEALDFKTPLLKSLTALDKAATDICQSYFDKNVTKVIGTLGWEQEYFLIDAALYNIRYDLQQTGRTLFGHAPAKGQQLEDHYWGSIPERVAAFMRDFEYESHLLGIPVRTRHNEVAPAQFECAPIFEETNIAVDHNTLLMDVMSRVAKRHKLVVLLHEKPFAGINGSGKHNNWSMATDTGVNLLAPGKTPKTNLMFLAFFVNTIKAVHDYSDVLRASIASAGNDHRLGANEAPPAILSIFIGKFLTEVLNEVKERVGDNFTEQDEILLKLDIHKTIPELLLDNTDRNRTSPFAFTGNKFEFRAVGSSANCANAMTVLNTIMADTLKKFKVEVDGMIEKGEKKEIAIMHVVQKYSVASKNVLFEGDGYSEEWHKEAAKRGLPNVPTTPVALDAMITDKAKHLFESNNVLTHVELEARHEIELEKYIKMVQIEARIMGELCTSHIVPSSVKYMNVLINNIKGLKELGLAESSIANQKQILEQIADHTNKVSDLVEKMIEARKVCNKISHSREKAIAYQSTVKDAYFDKIRYHVDKLELLVDDQYWLLPKYREMLFL